ncbi:MULTISPECIES: flavin monoamine oxidase family protein [Rhizobium]|uniref:Tryptophan 2-monooxygenase n=3 Tax=Rhizobium TaxID=379 RepID=A0A6P1CDX0_RHITR|nr:MULTISPECIES: flavin monoamine oxidase family protein [Rhizobium]AGB73646.1 putative tryptophan 2-monooxygenase [Rhizobium tropici CIAT 899]AYG70555.1 flavin monoamine oxidase family protein [Rhizobium sp. CCGE531]ENN83929.1 amine oxidase precursor [Rhizobium freirei PRF 81]MBB4245518.1 monoamine oxidase [Rhizobium tropici]MBB5596808.1 monoamine oxidase [Rhizobium tropici]
MAQDKLVGLNRRNLLSLIGMTAGSMTMYHAMTTLGLAGESRYNGPIKLEGAPKDTSVLILGAGLAGMTAALELRQAGYNVKILEYNNRVGGRNWTIRGGDSVKELGGEIRNCEFDEGLYINPGPWRIPYHHHGLLAYCKRLGVVLEPFQQLNHNAFLHSTRGGGGKPQRVRYVMTDIRGHISELLCKVTRKGALEGSVTKEDQEMLLEALRSWGALDENYAYQNSTHVREFRGSVEAYRAGRNSVVPTSGKPLSLSEILGSGLWSDLAAFARYEFQTTMFQPRGGIDLIGKAFSKEVDDLVTYNAKVTKIEQDEKRVTAYYEDSENPGTIQRASGDWCVCTIPLTILSQIDINVSAEMLAAIKAVPYASSVKVGLQFKRRFWEEDDLIFGGVSYTNLPIRQISYPSSDFNTKGKGVLLGCYTWNGPNSYEFTSMAPEERVKRVVEYGARIHPQYKEEFENGVSWAWHRSPFTLGCAGDWTEDTRREHFNNLCKIDGRVVIAGEHASQVPAWMEGAILSSLDAITRLHKRIMAG